MPPSSITLLFLEKSSTCSTNSCRLLSWRHSCHDDASQPVSPSQLIRAHSSRLPALPFYPFTINTCSWKDPLSLSSQRHNNSQPRTSLIVIINTVQQQQSIPYLVTIFTPTRRQHHQHDQEKLKEPVWNIRKIFFLIVSSMSEPYIIINLGEWLIPMFAHCVRQRLQTRFHHPYHSKYISHHAFEKKKELPRHFFRIWNIVVIAACNMCTCCPHRPSKKWLSNLRRSDIISSWTNMRMTTAYFVNNHNPLTLLLEGSFCDFALPIRRWRRSYFSHFSSTSNLFSLPWTLCTTVCNESICSMSSRTESSKLMASS